MKKETKAQHRKLLFMKFLNCLIAGGLVLVIPLTKGEINEKDLCIAAGMGLLAAMTQFKQVLDGEIAQHSSIKLFTFVGG